MLLLLLLLLFVLMYLFIYFLFVCVFSSGFLSQGTWDCLRDPSHFRRYNVNFGSKGNQPIGPKRKSGLIVGESCGRLWLHEWLGCDWLVFAIQFHSYSAPLRWLLLCNPAFAVSASKFDGLFFCLAQTIRIQVIYASNESRPCRLSDAVVITYTSPVITAVAAALLLGEAWGRLDALGSVLCMFGVVLISILVLKTRKIQSTHK